MIAFRKVRDLYGWLGNMSAHPIVYDGVLWRTSEALFQALRFSSKPIRDEIRAQKSPMAAKMVAKKHREKMVVTPRSEVDLENMRMVLRLKLEQYGTLELMLLSTGDEEIVEDTTARHDEYWGARLVDGKWVGQNVLGRMWMKLRDERRLEICEEQRKKHEV